MSSKQNLNAFFDKNKKKKPAPKTTADDAAPTQTPSTTVDSNEPKSVKDSKKVDYESSEEEKTDLILD